MVVIAPGSRVTVGRPGSDQRIPATVISVMIEPGDHVSYHCAWFDDMEPLDGWYDTFMVEAEDGDEVKVQYRE